MIFDKLGKIFNKKNTNENIAENNKDLEENVVYPEDYSGTDNDEGIDPDALFVPELNNMENDVQSAADKDINNEEQAGEFNDVFPAADNISPIVGDMSSMAYNTSEKIDYDAEIEALLKQDAETEIKNVDYDYINDISVYDTIRNDKEDVMEEIENSIAETEQGDAGEEKQEGLNIIYVALIGVLVVLIAAVVIFIFAAGSLKAKGNRREVNNADVIDVSSYKSNEANYIYLSKKGELDGEEFELSRILVDSKATLFYFKNKFDIQKYNIVLSDNNDNFYGMDLSFIQNMSNGSDDENNETVLRFEPLALNTKSIKLSLYNSTEGSRLDFDFDFSGPIESTPVKYIYNEDIETGSSDVKLRIDNAVFSSAGSTVNYTIQSSGDGFSIVQDKGKNSESIILEEGAENIKKLKKYPSTYSFNGGNIILGRMDFGSLENLNSKVYFTFKNLFKSYTVNRDINAQSLNGASGKEPISFEVGNYRVVLEGLGSFNDRIVLVFHGEDKNIPYDADNPNANRVETRLDAQIVSKASSGMEVILDGVSQSAEYGTDMSFMINDSNRNLIYSLGAGGLTVRVNSVLIKTEDVTCEFDLRKAKTDEDGDKKKASEDVISAFKERLAYKSGEKSIESILGFDKNLINEGSILSEYQPENLTERAQYSVQVIDSALMDDKYYAVIQEVWKGINGMRENHFYRTHKIVAQKGDYLWSVIEDNVIK